MVFLPKIHHPRGTMRKTSNSGHSQWKGTYKYLLKTVIFTAFVSFFSVSSFFMFHVSALGFCFVSTIWFV